MPFLVYGNFNTTLSIRFWTRITDVVRARSLINAFHVIGSFSEL